MDIRALCGFLLCTLTVNLLLHRLQPEFVPITTAACGLLFATTVLRDAANLLLSFRAVGTQYGLSRWTDLLLKSLAIALACQMTATLCRDCGENALAEKAELAGKIAILSLSMPIITGLLQSL